MHIHYLEIVTPDVEQVCAYHATVQGVAFSAPVANLGGACIATLNSGTILGIRAPLRPDEQPVVRPYFLVENIHGAAEASVRAGAALALPPMELTGYGTCAIVIHGGIESGLWQL